MRTRSPALSPVLRSVAAATLLVWLAALAFCAELCASPASASDAETPDCHAEAADSHHHDSDSSPNHHGTFASCLALKQALATKATTAFHPVLALLYEIPP